MTAEHGKSRQVRCQRNTVTRTCARKTHIHTHSLQLDRPRTEYMNQFTTVTRTFNNKTLNTGLQPTATYQQVLLSPCPVNLVLARCTNGLSMFHSWLPVLQVLLTDYPMIISSGRSVVLNNKSLTHIMTVLKIGYVDSSTRRQQNCLICLAFSLARTSLH